MKKLKLPVDRDERATALITELANTWNHEGSVEKEHYFILVDFFYRYVSDVWDALFYHVNIKRRIIAKPGGKKAVAQIQEILENKFPLWMVQSGKIKERLRTLREQKSRKQGISNEDINFLFDTYNKTHAQKQAVDELSQVIRTGVSRKKIEVRDSDPDTSLQLRQAALTKRETRVAVNASGGEYPVTLGPPEQSLLSHPFRRFFLPVRKQIPATTAGSSKLLNAAEEQTQEDEKQPVRRRTKRKISFAWLYSWFPALIGAVRTWRPAVRKTQLATVGRPINRRKFITALGTGVAGGIVGTMGGSSEQHNHANIATAQPKTPTEPKKMPAPMQYDENFDKIYNEAAPKYVEKPGPFGDFRDPNVTKGVLHYTRLPTILLEALITNNAAEMHVFRNNFLLMHYSYNIAQGIIDYKTSQEGQQLEFVLFDQAHGLTAGAIREHVDPYDGKTYIYDENKIAKKIRMHIYRYFEEYETRFGSLGFSYGELKHENKSDKHVTRFFTDANALFDSRVNELMEQRKQQGESSRNMLMEARYEIMKKMLYISIHLDDGETVTDNFNGPFFLLPSRHSSWTSQGKYLNKRREIGKAAGKYILARAKKYYNSTLGRREQQLQAVRVARNGGTPQKAGYVYEQRGIGAE